MIKSISLAAIICAAAILFVMPPNIVQAQSSVDTAPKVEASTDSGNPDISKLSRLRFITDNDYPPFNYLDESGNLVGFNVELARAICAELEVSCSVQALTWERMITAIEQDAADAIIASLAITKKNRRRVTFTRQYYQTPARFVTRKGAGFEKITPEILTGKRIGVAKGTSHEAYLKAFFSGSQIKSYDRRDTARQALIDAKVDAVFGDGVGLMFWLSGIASNGCCEFSGGPFTESKFFGEGVGIAVKKDNPELVEILNFGLDQVQKNGKYKQLFLRFFPVSFY